MLTINQISEIEADVRNENIYFSHLNYDLVDHICCEIEDLMQHGDDFPNAYLKVKSRIGYKGLKQIQNDTFYLIFKTYRKMKKTMKISGFLAPALLSLGSIFKMMHWPGAGVIILLGFITLCLVFLPTSVYVLYKETNNRKSISLYVSSLIAAFALSISVLFKIMHWPGVGVLTLVGITIAILVIIPFILKNEAEKEKHKLEKTGISIAISAIAFILITYLFKIQHWPGAAVLLIVSNVVLFLIALPIYTLGLIKTTNRITGKFIFTIIGSAWLILTLNLISVNKGVGIEQEYIDDYLLASELIEKTQHYNQEKWQLCSDTAIAKQLNTKTLELVNRIKNVKVGLIEYTNNIYSDGIKYHPSVNINKPFLHEVSETYMTTADRTQSIKKALFEYLTYVDDIDPTITKNVEFTQLQYELSSEKWAESYFSKSVLFAATYLTILQQNVLLIESELLENLTNVEQTQI